MRHRTTRPIAPARGATGLSLLLLILVAPSDLRGQELVGADRLGTRTAPLLLLTRADVQADLKLSREQIDSARETIRTLYAQAGAIRGQPDTPEVIEARRTIDQAQVEWIQSRLTVEQQTRLTQIDLQWEGPSALLTRSLRTDALGLSAEQRRALAEAVATRRRQRAAGRVRPEDEQPLAEAALTILTDEQVARWKSLLGRPFSVQPDRSLDPAVQTSGGTAIRR